MSVTLRMNRSTGGTSRSVNESRRFVVLANPQNNRVSFLNDALARRGRAPAVVVPWLDFLQGNIRLDAVLQPGDWLRIESPGRDAAVEAALVGVGRTAEHGEILFPRRWYKGFCHALEAVKAQCANAPPHTLLNDPDEIAVFFDKSATHTRFLKAGLPVPRRLATPESLAELAEVMQQFGVRQVFLKLAHSASASGVIAVRTDNNGRWRAYTTVEQSADRLYNNRRIRTIDDPSAIDSVIRALAPHGLHTEEWLPKAALNGSCFDLRALVVRGTLQHVIARLSQTPMTNLHLLNQRADAQTVRATVGEKAWAALHDVCERAAQVFPASLHIGLDVMWLPGFRRLFILEANAFGDLLPGTLWNDQTTYDTELEAAGC